MSAREYQSDRDLSDLLRQSNEQAYTSIYQRYWQRLYASAYSRLRDKEQCQDIIQTVFADLWRRREEVHIEDLAAYLHTAVRFQVFKQVARKPHSSEFLDQFDNMLASPAGADDALFERELLHLVDLWVEALPPKRRTVFLLYSHEQLSTGEIAERLGISQKTVQNQLNTAVLSLRLRLGKVLSTVLLASILKG